MNDDMVSTTLLFDRNDSRDEHRILAPDVVPFVPLPSDKGGQPC